MNLLLLKKSMLVIVNIFASVIIGELGFRASRNFVELNAFTSVLIALFTAFFISAFCFGSAYKFSQAFEQKKATKKQAIVGTLSLWALISFIMLAALFYKKLI